MQQQRRYKTSMYNLKIRYKIYRLYTHFLDFVFIVAPRDFANERCVTNKIDYYYYYYYYAY